MNLFKALTLDQLDKLTKILGILKVSGAVICKDNVSYLVTTASVKNIGLSKWTSTIMTQVF